jgi:hypothetical protein
VSRSFALLGVFSAALQAVCSVYLAAIIAVCSILGLLLPAAFGLDAIPRRVDWLLGRDVCAWADTTINDAAMAANMIWFIIRVPPWPGESMARILYTTARNIQEIKQKSLANYT